MYTLEHISRMIHQVRLPLPLTSPHRWHWVGSWIIGTISSNLAGIHSTSVSVMFGTKTLKLSQSFCYINNASRAKAWCVSLWIWIATSITSQHLGKQAPETSILEPASTTDWTRVVSLNVMHTLVDVISLQMKSEYCSRWCLEFTDRVFSYLYAFYNETRMRC